VHWPRHLGLTAAHLSRPWLAARMRALLALAIVLALAVPAAAQPPVLTQGYQARIALGDIPTTSAIEGAGWNVVQKVTVQHATGTESVVTLSSPAPTSAASCSCGNVSAAIEGGVATLRIPAATASGSHELVLASNLPLTGHDALGLGLRAPAGHATDGVVVLFLPNGYSAEAAVAADGEALACTQAACSIVTYTGHAGRALPDPMWLIVRPGSAAVAPAPADSMTPWLYAAVAFVAGCIVWALLVKQGMVQKRSRRQSVAVSAHEEAAAKESPAVLEGRKRALMAALKEVEVAKMNQEMDAATYDVVKADFKRQAVTVMRALESGETKS